MKRNDRRNSCDSEKKLKLLKELIRNKGNKEYPFLNKNYSVLSRIPCTDFTEWIIKRIEEDDIYAIKLLMHEIVRANPGWLEWFDKEIDSILSINFDEFIEAEKNAINELKSIYIILSKKGGGREFLVLEDIDLIVNAMCIYPVKINKEAISNVIVKANKFIKSMKKDKTPAWMNFVSYSKKDIEMSDNNIVENKIAKNLKNLPISARFHFFDTIKLIYLRNKKAISLYGSHFYKTRTFGLDIEESVEILLKSNLFTKDIDYKDLEKAFSKSELISIADSIKVNTKKHWNKEKILNYIIPTDEGKNMLDIAKDKKAIVYFNYKFTEDLKRINNYRNYIKRIYELLCFI